MVAASVIITATMITICYINSSERTHRYALPLQIMLTISTAGMPGAGMVQYEHLYSPKHRQ